MRKVSTHQNLMKRSSNLIQPIKETKHDGISDNSSELTCGSLISDDDVASISQDSYMSAAGRAALEAQTQNTDYVQKNENSPSAIMSVDSNG